MLHPEDFKKAIKAIEALGATPAVLVKVSELARDANADLSSMCELLRNDGPLAADIIRISNSPYYAPATPHSNLNSAVHQIGLREVNRVVNFCVSRRIFARDLPGYGISASEYWRASLAAALVMEAAAKQSGLNQEDAYTIGILHAIGRVLINQVINEKGFSLYWTGEQSVQEWERLSVGFDYAQSGAMLLEHWHFPGPTCDVIRWQLDPEKVDEQRSMLGALQFTRRLLADTGSDFERNDGKLPETDPFMRASGLTPAGVVQLVSTCRQELYRIMETVGVS